MSFIEGDESFQAQFDGTGDMQDIKRARPKRRRVSPGKICGALEHGAPEQVGGAVATLFKVIVERRECGLEGWRGKKAAMGSEREPVDHLDAAMMGDGEWG